MTPTLAPGDFVLVNTRAFKNKLPVVGDVVVARHPYQARMIIKRVSDVTDHGVSVLGDHRESSTDSRSFGQIDFSALIGQVTSRIS